MGTEREPFGTWLRVEIDRRGWSPPDFAARIGVAPATVNRWLNGRRLPDPQYWRRIADGLGVALALVEDALGHDPLGPQREQYELEYDINDMRATIARFDQRLEVLSERRLSELFAVVNVRDRGMVPADSVRWVATEGEPSFMGIPAMMIGSRNPDACFVVHASGDCLLERHIQSGDIVACEREPGRRPRNGELVIVRLGEEVTLKAWHQDGNQIELRDGAGNVVAVLSVLDDFVVEGYYVSHWHPPEPIGA